MNKEAKHFIPTVKANSKWIFFKIEIQPGALVKPIRVHHQVLNNNHFSSCLKSTSTKCKDKNSSILKIKDSNVYDTLDNKRDEGKEGRFNTSIRSDKEQIDVSST